MKSLSVVGASRGIAVKTLARTINATELFTGEVFSKEVLQGLEPIISEKFEYNTDVLDEEDIFEELEDTETLDTEDK